MAALNSVSVYSGCMVDLLYRREYQRIVNRVPYGCPIRVLGVQGSLLNPEVKQRRRMEMDATVVGDQATSVLPAVEAPVAREYLLTVRARFEATDDVAARAYAKERLCAMGMLTASGTPLVMEGDEVKLQEVSKSAPPRKVEV